MIPSMNFSASQVNRDATSETVKNSYRKLCLMYHPDKNSSPRASKSMNILNQEKRYIDDYFYYIDIQVVVIHDSGSDRDTEEAQ